MIKDRMENLIIITRLEFSIAFCFDSHIHNFEMELTFLVVWHIQCVVGAFAMHLLSKLHEIAACQMNEVAASTRVAIVVFIYASDFFFVLLLAFVIISLSTAKRCKWKRYVKLRTFQSYLICSTIVMFLRSTFIWLYYAKRKKYDSLFHRNQYRTLNIWFHTSF